MAAMLEIGDFVDSFRVDWDSERSGSVNNLPYYAKNQVSRAAAAVSDVIAGGQFLGQAIMGAAARKPNMRVQSIQGIFARMGRVSEQTRVLWDEIHSSQNFASVSMKFLQKDRPIAAVQLFLHVPDLDMVRHGPAMRHERDPEGPNSRIEDYGAVKYSWPADIDIRDAEATGPAELPLWMRYSSPPAGEPFHQALLAFGTIFQFIGTALRPHRGFSTGQAHGKLSTSPMTHGLSFHEPVDAGQWILVEHEAPYAGRGRAYGRGQAFSRDGRLLASITQDSMVRAMAPEAATAGQKQLL
jgi:acyl-CoA thioesterase